MTAPAAGTPRTSDRQSPQGAADTRGASTPQAVSGPHGSSAAQSVPTDRLALGPAGAERLTGVTDIVSEDGHGSGRATLGQWLADADGFVVEGATGVLVDDVLGSVAVARRPTGCWSLTTDLTFERMGPRLRPGTEVTGQAELLHADNATSLAEARVHDAEGRLVAIATQRGLYRPVPEEPEFVGGSTEPMAAPTAEDIDELLGLTCGASSDVGPAGGAGPNAVDDAGPATRGVSADAGEGLRLPVGPRTRNHVGILHGGISLMASMIAAKRELERLGHPGLVPVSAHLTFPRPVPEDEGTMQYTTVLTHAGRSFAVLRVYGMLRGTVRTMAQISAQRPTDEG
jgi:acyl-coenzyme A thioesterase PaaI-like protein